MKMKKAKTQINEIRNKNGETTKNNKVIIREYMQTYIQINWKIKKKHMTIQN
jgi:hypothetical protein